MQVRIRHTAAASQQFRRAGGGWRIFLLVCLAALVCALLSPAAARAEDPSFSDAVAQFQKGRWSDAYGRFIEMANEGDADAARIAVFMQRYGPLLFGSNWDAAADDRADWQRLAASRQGRPPPAFRPLEPVTASKARGKGPAREAALPVVHPARRAAPPPQR